jgi:hypothetical protein
MAGGWSQCRGGDGSSARVGAGWQSPASVARPTHLAGTGGMTMAVDTFVAYIGVYDNAAGADADYEAV